jgi:uncharacterized membrane protein
MHMPITQGAAMSVRDAIGIAFIIAGIALRAFAREVLDTGQQLAAAGLVAVGILLIWSEKRRRIEEALEDYPAR